MISSIESLQLLIQNPKKCPDGCISLDETYKYAYENYQRLSRERYQLEEILASIFREKFRNIGGLILNEGFGKMFNNKIDVHTTQGQFTILRNEQDFLISPASNLNAHKLSGFAPSTKPLFHFYERENEFYENTFNLTSKNSNLNVKIDQNGITVSDNPILDNSTFALHYRFNTNTIDWNLPSSSEAFKNSGTFSNFTKNDGERLLSKIYVEIDKLPKYIGKPYYTNINNKRCLKSIETSKRLIEKPKKCPTNCISIKEVYKYARKHQQSLKVELPEEPAPLPLENSEWNIKINKNCITISLLHNPNFALYYGFRSGKVDYSTPTDHPLERSISSSFKNFANYDGKDLLKVLYVEIDKLPEALSEPFQAKKQTVFIQKSPSQTTHCQIP